MMKSSITNAALKISTATASLALAMVGVSIFAACTVRTPTTETPVPNDKGIEKDFFRELVVVPSKKGGTETQIKPKTFLCGWAPISEMGAISSAYLTHAVHMAGHCNIEFDITNDYLVGRAINPSFPNNRERWQTIIRIPIKKHYYYERAKDSYGRETNEFVENSSRSDFSARPMMDLNLEGTTIDSLDNAIFTSWNWGTGQVTSVEDVEWDRANGFLGFTAVTQSPTWGGAVGARIRFNFKEFKHNPKFKVTPYSPRNAKHFNALHVMGEKVEGIHQIWSAAKWDLSKTHDIYLHGFPKEQIPMAEKVIAQWNAAFQQIGKPAAFRLNKTPMKYPFDLRYPMIVWVDDPQISAYSPLGIGMAQADVRNGEIIWGQVTLYTGYLEKYVKMHLGPIGSGSQSKSASQISDMNSAQAPAFFETYFNPTTPLKPGPGLSSLNKDSLLRLEAHLEKHSSKETVDDLARAIITNKFGKNGTPTARDLELARDAAAKILPDRIAAQSQAIRDSFAASMYAIGAQNQQAEPIRNDSRKLFGFLGRASSAQRTFAFGANEATMTDREKLSEISLSSAARLRNSSGGVVHDTDRRIIDVAPALMAGAESNGISYEEGLRKVIHELTLHEVGHMIGLGHQFKENILPAAGTVPAKYINSLNKAAANNWTNSTSVMGYKHPLTELLEDEADIAPGPQDLLTLRYLYNQEYATFEHGSSADEFTFEQVPASGIIPANNPEKPSFVTSYFPQCNDFDASFSADPYCNRFDRGNDAQSIVKSYFDDLNANMVSKIYAFTDSRGGNTESAESYLWYRALTTLGRVRVFYDHMRQKFESEIRLISNSERDLYEFSRVCADEMQGSRELEDLFSSKPELKELCKVNRMAVKEMTNLLTLPGPDRSRMDWDNAVMAAGMNGGDANSDYSRIWGTHTALSVMPFKLSAINALTTPTPYMMYSGWLFPIPRYSGADGLFSYSTLYSTEFTEALAIAAEKNLKLASLSGNSTSMGLPITSMGYFLEQQAYANDSTRMPKDFIENIRNQTRFRLSVKAVILDMKTREDVTRVTHFEGQLYDPNTDRSQKLEKAFVLPAGKIIVRPGSQNFVYPITKIMFISDTSAYAWAYHIEYDVQEDDILASRSVKATLEKLNGKIIDSCIGGNNDGLESFFTTQEDRTNFPGFLVMSGIATQKEKQLRFLESVKTNFAKFYELRKSKNGQGPTAERCEDAVRGVGLIVATAGMLNGYFLPEVLDYLVK